MLETTPANANDLQLVISREFTITAEQGEEFCRVTGDSNKVHWYQNKEERWVPGFIEQFFIL